MPLETLRAGEIVMLVDARDRCTLKRLQPRHRITIRGSVLRCDDIIGLHEGVRVGADEPESFLVFRPSHAELVTEMERPAEPIFAKDVGAILAHGDVRAGDHVLEVGVGSGALSIALLRAVGSAGRVTSYEVRADFAEVAQRNVLTHCGPVANWNLVVADAERGIDAIGVDRAIVDVPDPVSVLLPVTAALRPGGTLVAYLPTILQVKELRDALRGDARFALVETLEVFEREWQVEPKSIRPAHRMVAHTAFLTFARRTTEPAQP
jgi:tRNA (adenine57-N1/adenine58-N1)-methyltransferase